MFLGSEKTQLVSVAIATIPYLLISGAYATFMHGGAEAFGLAFGVLLGARLFFAAVEGLGAVLAWRLYSRKIVVDNCLRWLRANEFPMRYYRHDDFTSYLGRVEGDDAASPRQRSEAKSMYAYLGMIEDLGVMAGVRTHAATEIALEIYSPKKDAPRKEGT